MAKPATVVALPSIALPGIAVPAPPPWRDWIAELWWLLNFADALLLALLRAGAQRAGRIPPAALGPLACVALCGYMGVRAVSEYLADPRPIMQVLAAPILVALGFLLFCAWVCSGLAPITIKTGGRGNYVTRRRTITGAMRAKAHYAPSPNKPKTPLFTAKHEGGHGAVAEYVGGYVIAAEAHADGSGWCLAHIPGHGTKREKAIRWIAFFAGGEVAVHSRAGCGGDQANIDYDLRSLSGKDRSGARAEGYAKARAGVSARSGTVNRIAASLVRHGRYTGWF